MTHPIQHYLDRLAATGDHAGSVLDAVALVAHRPWEVVRWGRALSRCTVSTATDDMALTAALTQTTRGGRDALIPVAKGQPFPQLSGTDRWRRGTYGVPIDMARRVVSRTIAAAHGEVQTLLDPAAGCGAFLLAAAEAGVAEVYGTVTDPLMLQIAMIAVPSARMLVESPFRHGPLVDVVVGRPPMVPDAHRSAADRADLERRFPWMGRRFDTDLGFAASAVSRVRPGGAAGLVLPVSLLRRAYGSTLRRRWLQRHRFVEISEPHILPESDVAATMLVLGCHQTPAPLPVFGLSPDELLGLADVPINPDLWPGDVDFVRRIREASVMLGDVCRIEDGLVVHGPGGGKERLIFEDPAEGRVPFADARDYFAKRIGWLDYRPNLLHRPKRPELFERTKIVVERARTRGPIRADIDWRHTYVGNSCSLILPTEASPPVERLIDLIRSPFVDAVLRIEAGGVFDLFPGRVATIPVPRAWLKIPDLPLHDAWGVDAGQLEELAGRLR